MCCVVFAQTDEFITRSSRIDDFFRQYLLTHMSRMRRTTRKDPFTVSINPSRVGASFRS